MIMARVLCRWLPKNRLTWALGLAWAWMPWTLGCQQMASTAINTDGVRLYQQGDYQAASQRFMHAMATDPTDPDSYYNLAATHHRLGKLLGRDDDLKQAENLYNQCLDRNPDSVECHRALAVLLNETSRPDAAMRLLEGWSARNPQQADPKIELARLHEELGESEKARQRLQEALAFEPNNPRALTALGKLREASGEFQQALAVYQRSLQINRFQPEVLARVAVLQTTVGNGVTPPPPINNRMVTQPDRPSRY